LETTTTNKETVSAKEPLSAFNQSRIQNTQNTNYNIFRKSFYNITNDTYTGSISMFSRYTKVYILVLASIPLTLQMTPTNGPMKDTVTPLWLIFLLSCLKA